jgi:hypothetical protein
MTVINSAEETVHETNFFCLGLLFGTHAALTRRGSRDRFHGDTRWFAGESAYGFDGDWFCDRYDR